MKGVVYLNGGNNKLMFVGSQYNIYIANMFDAQAVFVRANILGTLRLPSTDEMRNDVEKWMEKEKGT